MNFQLDDKETYLNERRILKGMPISKLKELVGKLYEMRYEEHDIEVHSYHRLASSVLIDRTKNGDTLIFHLKNFIGLLVVSILIGIFNK